MASKKPPLLRREIMGVAIALTAANMGATAARLAGSKEAAVAAILASADEVEKILNDFEALCLERECPEGHAEDWEEFSAPHRQAVAGVRAMMIGLEVRP